MPPAKRSPSSTSKSSPASRPAAKRTGAAKSASAGAKSTATTARKATGRTTTQAKSGATRTSRAASAGTAKTARTAEAGAKATASRAKAANTATKRASGGEGIVATTIKNALHPSETVTLTRDKIQETLDDAAARGRVTRKDANALVTELMRRGRSTGDDVRDEVGELLGKGVHRIESATRKVRKAEPVDRLVRGADRARRAAGVGPTFPIVGYDELNVSQVQARIKELSKPDQRKVLTYERRNANRKSVVGALEKSLA